MAKLNLNTQEAIDKIKQTILYLQQLKTTTGQVSKANAESIRILTSELDELENKTKKVKSAFQQLKGAYATAIDNAKSLALMHGKSSKEAKAAAASATYLANKIKSLDDIGRATIKTDKERLAIKKKLIAEQKRERATILRNKAALDKQRQSALKSKTAFGTLTKSVTQLMGAFGLMSGVQIFADLARNSYDLIKTFDSIDFAMEKITKTSFDLGVSQRFLIELSMDFGVELAATSKRWTRFLAAAKQSGITLLDTQEIFASMTKAASVLGLQTDELSSVFLALEQMLSKGKVTTEELRRQLGERLPGAMGIMAASMGVSISKLDEMLKKGEVLSSEVLPNFARAVEIAYGIESLEKVENLTAAQNRLTTAWQLFIKFAFEDSGVMRGFFDGLRSTLEALINMVGTTEQKRKLLTIGYLKDIEKAEFDTAKTRWDSLKETGEKYQDLTNAVKKAQQEQNDSMLESGSKEGKILQDNLDKAIAAQTTAMMEIRQIERENAEWSIDLTREAYEEKKKELAKYKMAQESGAFTIKDEESGVNTMVLAKTLGTPQQIEEQVDFINDELAKLEAQLEYFRLLKEKSNIDPDIVKPKGGGSTKTPRAVKDYSDEIKVENLKRAKRYNEEELALDETLYTKKRELISQNAGIEARISEIIMDAKIKDVNEKAALEIAAAGAGTARAAELEVERGQQVEVARSKHKTNMLNIELQHQSDLQRIGEEEMNKFQQEYDEQIRAVELAKNTELKIARETSKSKEELQEREKEINDKYWQEQNDYLIMTVKKWITYAGSIDLATDALEDLLEELQLMSKSPGFDPEQAKPGIEEWMELAGAAIQEIGNIAQAVFDRRIENINAEIDAEKEKYDKLIAAAHLNNDEQVRLEEEKAARIAILEKKRLAEEQKAAKWRKAMALIEIGMSTAQAVMTNIKLFGLPLGSAFNIATIALGALQAATVLAAPIPQYKDGLGFADRDHTAMINDGVDQEYVGRGGQLLTSNTKNAIVGLKTGDTVFKDKDAVMNSAYYRNKLQNISVMASLGPEQGKTVEIVLDEKLSGLRNDIKKGIQNGFRDTETHNHINIDLDWMMFKNDTL